MNRRTALLLGSVAYAVQLILSIIYFKQRTVIFDMSFQLFSILKDNSFAIQVNRFGAFLTQIFPLFARRAGFSLHGIAIIYSAAFVLYYFLIFLFILQILKNTRVALALLLFNTLTTTHSFFWIQSELLQGVAFALLFIALVENQLLSGNVSLLFLALSPVFLITIAFFYPLLPFVLLYILAYFFLYYNSGKNLLLALGSGYILLYLIKVIFFKTTYDTNSMSGVKNFVGLFPNYINLQSNRDFVKWLLKDYYTIVIFTIAVIIFYLKKRKFMRLLLFAASSLVLVALINVCYFYGQFQFYLEPQYSILSIFISFPLVYDILPQVKIKIIPVFLVSCIILCSVFRIFNSARIYTERLNWFRKELSLTSGKVIIKEQDVPIKILKLTWGSAYEFWLLSTLETNQSRSVIIEGIPHEFDGENNKKVFLTKYGAYDYDQLNKKYFIFNDTVSLYTRK
jgi:hypothetical protein